MTDNKSLYFALFNQVTDAIRLLQAAQQEAEEQYLRQIEKAQSPKSPAQT